MLVVTEMPDTSCLKNLKITMAYTVCQGQQHHSRAIWKILKITIPVKLAEQWNEPTSCCTGTIKGQFLSLSMQRGASSFLAHFFKHHWWTPETHTHIQHQGSNLKYSALSPRKSTILFTVATYIGQYSLGSPASHEVTQNLLLLLICGSGVSEKWQRDINSLVNYSWMGWQPLLSVHSWTSLLFSFRLLCHITSFLHLQDR